MTSIAKILIVDDQAQTIQHVRALLHDYGYLTQFITKPEYLFQLLDKEAIDLILLDINMPQLDGFTLLEQLQNHPQYSDIPVIMLTADQRDSILSQCFEKGARDFVTKPISPLVLQARIQSALATKHYAHHLEQKAQEKTLESERINEKLQQEAEEHKKTEKELTKLVTAIEQAEASILITDKEGRIEYVNPYFEQLSGYRLEEVKGKNPNILKSHQHDVPFYKDLWETILNNKIWRGQIINKKKDGAFFTVEMTISPVKDDLHNITHFIAVNKDITEKLALEQQLRHAQKMKAISVLAGGIAHDFNNILFTILGNAELLKHLYHDKEEGKEHIDAIMEAGRRAQTVISQLLTFTRSQETPHRPVDIVSTIEDSLQMARTILPANIEIRQNLDSDSPFVLGNKSQLQQAVFHIYINAKEAMADKQGLLDVTLQPVEFKTAPDNIYGISRGSYVHVAIRDTGKGIPVHLQEHIFDPFFTTKGVGGTEIGPSKEGTGLGLTGVYNIIRNHKGGITVESEVAINGMHESSGGTTFHLYFPTIENGLPKMNLPIKSTGKIQKISTPLENKYHILVAEDEVQLAKVYRSTLEEYQVTLCQDGHEALEMFRNSPKAFDLLLTDQEMPKLTGIQLSQEILKIRPEFPIILVTGYSDQITEDNFKEYGIQQFFLKPLDSDELLDAIQSIVSSKEE